MNLIPAEHEEKTPYLQLLMLAVYAVVGLTIGLCLTYAVLILLYGTAALSNYAALSGEVDTYVTGIKIGQSLTTICLFIVPAVWLAKGEKMKLGEFYGFKKPTVTLLFLVLLLMIFSMPLMEWFAVMNQKMVLPEFLKFVQDWMRDKEDEAAKMTILLLKTGNVFDFLVNMVVIALLPAISEELLFRGAVQRSFYRMFNNPHVAIWVAAFIFSAIHMQFFGFFPRLFLGAAFGYIYLWTGSLWYAMFAHFLNNGYAVALAWYLQAHHRPLSDADNANFPWYGYVISLILTVCLFKYFKDKNTQNYGKQLG